MYPSRAIKLASLRLCQHASRRAHLHARSSARAHGNITEHLHAAEESISRIYGSRARFADIVSRPDKEVT